MKILQINSVCGVGSTGRIVIDVDSALRENGIESYVAYGRNTSIVNDNVLKIGTRLDYYMHGALTRLFDTHALQGSKWATNRFIEQIINIDPDIVHLHNLHGYFINVKPLFDYLKEAGKPVVWTLHDCWSFTGHCAYFSYIQCDRWIEGCFKCPNKNTYPLSVFLDNSQRNYYMKKSIFTKVDNLTVVTPSKWLANLVRQSFLSKYPVKVIHNGIDTNMFKPVDSEVMRKKYNLFNKFVILGVANGWGPRKGLHYFIELSKMIDDDCKIVLVGLKSKQISELPKNIIGIKKVSNINELAQIYSVANVFFNPSVEETFGLVTAESLACGTPALVFDSTPGVEILADGCGYVTEIGNLHDVIKSIDQIRKNGKMYYAAQCVRRVKEHFDKQERYQDYLELYKQIDEISI